MTMSRYVKADMIGCPCGYCEGYDECQKEVEEAPSIDIVFYKECRWNENTCINHGEMKPWCKFTDYVHTADDFCSYGEKDDTRQ